MIRREGQVTDEYGRAVPGATVYVFNQDGSNAQLYSDANGTVPLALGAPVSTDSFGTYSYYSAAGIFREDTYYAGKLRYREVLAVGIGGAPAITVTASAGNDVSSRPILAGIANPANLQKATLTEPGREGTFVFSTANLSSQVTNDPNQGVYVAPSSDTTGASGAWVRKDKVITPEMFGAGGAGATDDTTALNKFFAFIAANKVVSARLTGTYNISSTATYDGSATYGNSPASRIIDWGNAIFVATAPMDHLLSMFKLFNSRWIGLPEIRGTGYLSDAHTSWTCNTGIYLDYCTTSKFDGAYFQGLAYAGFEITSTPGNNNDLSLGHCHAKRVSSGDAHLTRSLTANWSSPVRSGAYGSVSQTVTLTVDTFPNTYVTGPDGAPVHPIFVQINGRLHPVSSVSRAAGTITLGRWIPTADGTSGTLLYHYGATIQFARNDANIAHFERASIIAGGCALEFAAFYGGDFGMVHAESAGCAVRLAATGGSGTMNGGTIANVYNESGNTFNIVLVGRSATHVKINSRAADTTASKNLALHLPLLSTELYEAGGVVNMLGVTMSATEGYHYRRKTAIGSGSDIIDFGAPRTFDGQVFYTSAANIISLALKAPATGQLNQYGYDCAHIVAMGSGAFGQPTTVTFTLPNAAHTITANGVTGAAGASLALSGFRGPAIITIRYDDNGSWRIGTNQPPSATATYDPPSLATGVASPIQTMTLTGAVVGDAVAMAFSNNLSGARLVGWVSGSNVVSYYFVNEAGTNPLDLASGTVTARIIR